MRKQRKIPFPQANNIELIYSILLSIGDDGYSKRNVASTYEMDERQGSYYLDTLEFLGFVEKINSKYFLTKNGMMVANAPENEKLNVFIKLTLTNEHINYLYEQFSCIEKETQKLVISNYISNKFLLGINTANRRASSIMSWFKWIKQVRSGEI